MTQFDVVLGAVVVLTFLMQIVNYYWFKVGSKHCEHCGSAAMTQAHRLLFMAVLSGFVVTEAMIAVDRPIYVLYVVLNFWGLYCLWTGKKP